MNMATIELKPDNIVSGIWWLRWVERDEIIGKVVKSLGRWEMVPQGPHWSPMKSLAGQFFDSPELAADEVRLYFGGR